MPGVAGVDQDRMSSRRTKASASSWPASARILTGSPAGFAGVAGSAGSSGVAGVAGCVVPRSIDARAKTSRRSTALIMASISRRSRAAFGAVGFAGFAGSAGSAGSAGFAGSAGKSDGDETVPGPRSTTGRGAAAALAMRVAVRRAVERCMMCDRRCGMKWGVRKQETNRSLVLVVGQDLAIGVRNKTARHASTS